MRILITGSGGREHAIALRLSRDKSVTSLFCVPGNPGTENIAVSIPLDVNNHQSILDFCCTENIDLVVVGPEQPLVDGLSDKLRNNGIRVFGPSADAARIESSKSFAKRIMLDANVPTADYREFTPLEYSAAKNFINSAEYPLVIKADGLAAGKGVIICNEKQEAESALNDIFEVRLFGESGNKILIEEFLQGEEASIFVVTDGQNFVSLPPAQDHKRIGDNDTGKNTGGMGAYCPAPVVDEKMMHRIEYEIIIPTLEQMRLTGNNFIGCLYAGLMICESGPKVIEFNCRFGDPETQAVLPLVEGDFAGLLYSAAGGNIDGTLIRYSGGSSVCIVAASKGYPDDYKKGFEISGLARDEEDIIIYHAGTKKNNDTIVTNGGRVLGVTSVMKKFDLPAAQKKAYEAIRKIHFEGIYYRSDIASKAFKRLNE